MNTINFGTNIDIDMEFCKLTKMCKNYMLICNLNIDSNNLKQIYRCLDVLDECSEKIQLRMNNALQDSSLSRDTKLTYYDVTNYFFEIMYNDEDILKIDEKGNLILDENGKEIIEEEKLRKRGHSKENKQQPIVQMGLFLDSEGIPLSYRIFPGNITDTITFKKILEEASNKKKLINDGEKVVVVADNGMHSQYNCYALTENGDGYIFSKSLNTSWSDMSDFVLDQSDYKGKSGLDSSFFKYKSRIVERTLKSKVKKDEKGKPETKVIKEKQIVFWSKKHYEKQLKEFKQFKEYIEKCAKEPKYFKKYNVGNKYLIEENKV